MRLKPAPRGRAVWLPANAVDYLSFFLSLFVGGALYIVFGTVYTWVTGYQQTNYPSGVFLQGPLLAWEYGWAAIPAILLISLVIGLIVAKQKRNLSRI